MDEAQFLYLTNINGSDRIERIERSKIHKAKRKLVKNNQHTNVTFTGKANCTKRKQLQLYYKQTLRHTCTCNDTLNYVKWIEQWESDYGYFE